MCSVETLAFSLETILENPSSEVFKAFATYLQRSYCIENLEFWLATQEYKECANDRLRCEKMIEAYIQPNSPQEINIPCDIRQSILEFYSRGYFHPNIFHAAAEAVLELMRVNSFVPWLLDQNHPWKPTGIKHSMSTSSLSDRWNLVKLKQISRKSWSSLDDSRSADRFTLAYSTQSVYKSMLKKIKRSLSGKH
ncbi:hypothetical protein G6F56_006783 [Rhizopus delemar]|nr:hypothetical protein G6F56_006783 [Rhizopus delemar]